MSADEVTLSTAALRALMAEAAEEGARKALSRVGLHDEDAAEDVRELRGLIEAWREARRTAWQSVVRGITTATLVALAIGVAFQLRGR